MLLILTVTFLLKRYGTYAVPLPAPTPTSSPFDKHFLARDEPSDGYHGRTVLDILWSCLVTTFACTWVSVHPNVPFRGEGKWPLLARRIYLMFFSILAPEFMIMWAFKQWRGAVMIREAVNEARPESNWTTTHGHFLQMGGFRCEGNVMMFDRFISYLRSREIRFPDIIEDEINDRSKGDALSKGIALLQLTWFIIQIITRAVQGLVITELELTTAALAGLNSIMYIFWWNKPRDVRFPVVIRTRAVEKLLAERTEDTVVGSFPVPKEFDFRGHLWMSMTTPIKDGLSDLHSFLVYTFKTIRNIPSYLANAIKVLPHHIHYYLSQFYRLFLRAIEHLKGDRSVDPKDTGEKGSSNAPAVGDPQPDSEEENVSQMQQICQVLIRGAKTAVYCFAFLLSMPAYVMEFGLASPISQILHSNGDDDTLPMVFDTKDQVRVLSMMFYSESAEVQPLFSTASIAGALFGGVHCLAWHFSFPSHAEQIVWRTASLGVVGACALSFVGTNTLKYIRTCDSGLYPDYYFLFSL